MGASTTSEGDFAHGVDAFRLAVVIGGMHGHGAAVTDWFIRQVERHGESGLDVIDLAELAELAMPAHDAA